MFILVTTSILFITALTLVILQYTQPAFRFAWLTAAGGTLLAWMSVLLWQTNIPAQVQLSLWEPASLFHQSPFFVADGLGWSFALSLASLCVAIIITAVARPNFPNVPAWIGILILTALGILAVTADNPLTLVLIWAALDLAEFISQMRLMENPQLSERAVIAFASRTAGILILLWANMIGLSQGSILDFRFVPPQAGLYLILAASLRLGVIPLHLPYPDESGIRRGFGTGLRMVSAGSSLVLLARIPANGIETSLAPLLMLLVSLAALYGGWMWLRAPDELTARPFWLIGIGALAVSAALRGDPIGATAWGCALILSGGALFLYSLPSRWLTYALFIGVWSISTLPFSLTATAWQGSGTYWYTLPLLIASQAMLLAGLIRHIQRASARSTHLENQPIWAKNVYPLGIVLILTTIFILTFFGWEGALQIGNWLAGIFASLLTLSLLPLIPRFRIFNPVRAHWVRPLPSTRLEAIYEGMWNLYYRAARLSDTFSRALEGESGVMWTLLLLALFISMLIQGIP